MLQLQSQVEQEKIEHEVLKEKLGADNSKALKDARDQFDRENALMVESHVLELQRRDDEIAANQQRVWARRCGITCIP